MKKQIKLTQKQEEVLRRYHELIVKHNYQTVYVDEAYVDMTALNPIVGANWFDRTFEALVQKGLLVRVEEEKVVEEGYFEGREYTDWYWKLTELGKEYLGIEEPEKACTKQELETVFKLVAEGYKTTEEIAKVSGMDIFRVEWTLAKLHITSYIKCSMAKGIEITRKGYKQLEIWKAREEITVNDIEVLKQIAEGKDTNKNMTILKRLNTAGYITTKGTKTNFKCNTTKKGLEFILFNK